MEVSSKMSSKSRVEVLERARERYLNRGKEGRGRLLDEICSLCGYERKYDIKVLGGLRPIAGSRDKKRGGSVPKYGKEERRVFQVIWMAAEQPCGKRMKHTVKTWLPHYEKRHGQLGAQVRERILKASAATIDRLLAPSRFRYGKRRCATRPGNLLRSQIPVRTEHWDVEGPGFLEADTVAHCGGSLSGEHCWSLTVTDVHTQWTETRATPNRGQEAVRRKIADIEGCLPFAILGFDTDNGGEFLNWHLVDYFQKREKLLHAQGNRRQVSKANSDTGLLERRQQGVCLLLQHTIHILAAKNRRPAKPRHHAGIKPKVNRYQPRASLGRLLTRLRRHEHPSRRPQVVGFLIQIHANASLLQMPDREMRRHKTAPACGFRNGPGIHAPQAMRCGKP
jgi:hypothetical protein